MKYILLAVNILFVVLFVGSTLSGVVDPRQSMLVSLLSYAFLHLFCVNVAFVFLWLLVRSRWFLLSLIVIAIRFPLLPHYFQVGGTESLKPSEVERLMPLKVMSFNVHGFHGVEVEASKDSTDANMQEFLAIVDGHQPDILSLQEYIGRGDTVMLTKELTRRGYRYQASGYTSNTMTGEVVFSKLPIVNVCHIDSVAQLYVDLVGGGDTIGDGRGYSVDTFRLFCLHFHSYRLDESDHRELSKLAHGEMDSTTGRSTYRKFREAIERHEQQWEVLSGILDETHYPSVFTGDFNDTPASALLFAMRRRLEDSYREAGQGFSSTYHGPFASLRKGLYLAYRIDYVLHTPELKAYSYHRLRTDISDHYPIIVNLAPTKQ